jgi:AcrR family transcriptional regulator
MAMRKGKPLLTREDWADAALRALAAGGVGAVSINALAKQLGASRGSFYWHFADRAALIEAALLRWEQTGTTEIVDELERITDPRLQLRYGVQAAFANLEEGDIEAALAAHASDPLVAPVLERVAMARLRALHQVFERMGFDADAAAVRAKIAFAIYLGHFQLRRALPATGQELSLDYIDQLVAWVSEPPASPPESPVPPVANNTALSADE